MIKKYIQTIRHNVKWLTRSPSIDGKNIYVLRVVPKALIHIGHLYIGPIAGDIIW